MTPLPNIEHLSQLMGHLQYVYFGSVDIPGTSRVRRRMVLWHNVTGAVT